MGEKTGINWTDSTVNPILAELLDGKLGFHCVKVSAECAFCYAETFNERNLTERGTGLPYQKRSGDQVKIVLHRPALDQVLRWSMKRDRKPDGRPGDPRPRKIFWCSMTDLFGEFVPSWMIQECLDVAVQGGEAQGHISQILTKRPERMLAEIQAWTERHGRPLPACVWPGFSAGNRELFFGTDGGGGRWQHVSELFRRGLADGPLWCSYEPSIGPLVAPSRGLLEKSLWRAVAADGLRWLVWGGESGQSKDVRPFDASWAVAVVKFVADTGISIWGKQFGAKPFCPYDAPAGLFPGDLDEVLERFLDRPHRVIAPGGKEWDHRPICDGGDGPAPVGTVVQAKFGTKGEADRDRWPELLKLQQFPGEAAAS